VLVVDDEDAERNELTPVLAFVVEIAPVVVQFVVPFSKPPLEGVCPKMQLEFNRNKVIKEKANLIVVPIVVKKD
jgi:hypothetical protein